MRVEVEIDSSSLARQLDEEVLKRETSGLAREWYERAIQYLYDRGEDEGYEIQAVAQTSQPPAWDDGAWRIEFPHEASVYFEYGTDDHTVEPDGEVLVFPWPDAPADVKEDFEGQWSDPGHWLEEPYVIFPRTEVEGISRLRFVRDAREDL